MPAGSRRRAVQRASLAAVFAWNVTFFANSSSNAAAFYAGPGFDPVTFEGWFLPELPIYPGSTASDGFGVFNAQLLVGGNGTGKHGLRLSPGGFVELGGLGLDAQGHYDSYVFATNASQTAVGNASQYDSTGNFLGNRPVRWTAGSSVATELQSLGTDSSGFSFGWASAVNASGAAAGDVDKYDANGNNLGRRAVRWDANSTTAIELGHIGLDDTGSTRMQVFAMNDAGTVVGAGQKRNGTSDFLGFRAIRWDAGGTAATELGNLGLAADGSTGARAQAINNAGTAVGASDRYVSGNYVGQRAVRWDSGSTDAVELDPLSVSSGQATAIANAINDAGTIVGASQKYGATGNDLGSRAVRWDFGGTAVTELQQLETNASGQASSVANDISATGLIVGTAFRYSSNIPQVPADRAVLWNTDGSVLDLNSLLEPNSGWVLTYGISISDTNWITGIGYYDIDGPGTGAQPYRRMFLLQVPEPTTMSLLSLAFPLAMRRRKP